MSPAIFGQYIPSLPCEFVDLCDEVVLDDVEGVLGGQQLVVLRDQVLNLLPHA